MLEIVKQVTEKLEFSWITSDTMVDQMHIYDIVGTNITTVSGMRMIYRGGYAYTLVADVPLNRISELYSFFNSFEVLPLSEENYTAPVTEPDWFKIPSPIQAQLEYGLALENFLIPVIETKSYVGLDAKSGQSFEAYHFVVDSLSFNTNEKAMEMVDFAIQDYLYSYGDSIIEDMDLGPFCKRISIIDAERKETYTAAVLLTGKDIFVTLSSINRETATLPQVSEWMAFPFGKAPKKEPTYNEVHWQEYYSRLKNSNAQNAASLYQSLAFLPLFDLSFGQLDSMLMLNLADSMVNVDMIYLLSDAMFAQDENRTLKTLANKFSSNSNYDSRTAALYQIASRQNANSTMQLFALLPEMQTNVDLNPIYEFYEMDSLKYVHPFMQAFQVMLPTYDYLYNDLAYIIANEENRETLDVLLHPKIVGHLVDYSIQLRSNWSADSDEIVDTYFTQINMAFVANALRKAAQYENARSELANYLSGQYSEQAQVEALIFAIENNDPKTLPMESVQQLADNPEYMAVVVDIFQQHGLLNMLSKKITNQKTICEKFLGRLEIEGFDNSCQLDMVGKFDYEGKAYNYYVFHYSEDPSNYAICGPFPKGGMLVTTLDENNIQVGTFETNSKKELKVIVEEIMKTSLRDGLVRY
jgi:hypothetical protein